MDSNIPAGRAALPDYERPPVVETVLGVEFSPLKGWDVHHYGLYWAEVRERFPRFETKPPLPPSGVGEGGPFNLFFQQLGGAAATIRCWLIDDGSTRLLQVQHDRFIHNWRKIQGDEEYPHYDRDVRPRFASELDEFRAFLAKHDIPEPTWRRCEVTYINHLERGREWNTLADIPKIFPAVRSSSIAGGEFSVPDSVNLRWKHRIDPSVEVTLALQSATRRRDAKDVLQYQISAQTVLSEGDDRGAVMDAMDTGRFHVVQNFDTSTSPEMHAFWGRKERVA